MHLNTIYEKLSTPPKQMLSSQNEPAYSNSTRIVMAYAPLPLLDLFRQSKMVLGHRGKRTKTKREERNRTIQAKLKQTAAGYNWEVLFTT